MYTFYSSSSFIDIIGRDRRPPLRRGLSPGLPSGLSSRVIVIGGGRSGLEALPALKSGLAAPIGLKSGLAIPASISDVSGLGAGIKF